MHWTVTVTTNATDLKSLCYAYDQSNPGINPALYEVREFNLLADNSNGAAIIYVGGSNVSSSDYSVALGSGMSRYYPPKTVGSQRYYLQTYYVKSSTGSLTLHIEAS
jgi:hypothetical protein